MAIYLKYADLSGNVTSKTYQNWIELDSIQWGFSVAVQTGVGNASNRLSSGKVTPGDMHISKQQDDTSTKFMTYSLLGKSIDKAVVAVTIPGENDEKYMEYMMYDVICSSFSSSGVTSGGQPMESISLNFSKIEFAQYPKDKSNTGTAVVRGGYDFSTNKKV